MKAFLSHSSLDKEFVEAVAKELGRQFSVFDKQSFTNGEEFKTSIEKGLDDSDLFVLFASRSSSASVWVGFEVEEAWYRRLRSKITKSLVYIIDSSLKPSDLPEWLQRALISRQNAPKPVARDIRHQLDELLRQRQHPFFFGRSGDVDEIEKTLTPLDGSPPPHALFVTGLPGIGRRSLIRNSVPKILNLPKQVEIRVGAGDSINDICAIVADHTEPYSTKQGFEHIFNQIQSLSEGEALKRALGNIRHIVAAGELPIFIDEGGLLDGEGFISEPILAIIRALEPNDEAYIFFVSARRPQSVYDVHVPVVRLEHLRDNETKRLVAALVNQSNLEVSPETISELAGYTAGYPPSAYFAVKEVKEYGVDLVMRDKTRLVKFRTSIFLRHFSKLHLSDKETALLRLSASYSPLPLAVIAEVLTTKLDIVQDMVIRLIDLSLMATTEDGYYRISDPITDAAASAYGFPPEDQHKALADRLYNFLEVQDIGKSRLELTRVLFRAAKLARNTDIASKTIHLANDLVRLVETLYHARKYDEAILTAHAALDERPGSVNARDYLIRSLIQEEHFVEAEEQLSKFRGVAPPQDYYFLSGFLARYRGDTSKAIQEYKEAQRLGRRGAAINRELANCYFLANDLVEAAKYIKVAMNRHSDNRYVVDLWVQIATRQRDEPAVREALSRLEVLDKPIFYYHRLSRVELAFGRLLAALEAAYQAVLCEHSPPFEVLAQLAFCEIALGHTEKAENTLSRIDKQFRNVHFDNRTGLRCRLEIALERFSDAIALTERIRDKNTFFYKQIRRDALMGELRTSALPDQTRRDYEQEIAHINQNLANIPPDQLLPIDIN